MLTLLRTTILNNRKLIIDFCQLTFRKFPQEIKSSFRTKSSRENEEHETTFDS
jgi:hypothetical protein